LKDAGHKVEERKITLDEVRKGITSGEIVEVFACGTAAVITPVGIFKSTQEEIVVAGNEAGPVTIAMRQELTGIQYGTVPDRHNWMLKLAD